MRFVGRDGMQPVPSFASSAARESREALLELFLKDEVHLSQSRSSSTFAATEEDDIRAAVGQLFNNCCAFCESPLERLLIHRFRPSTGASPINDPATAHLYYVWLAEAAQNLYPICHGCLPDDPFRFPVINGARSPLPDRDVLLEYLKRNDGRWPRYPLQESSLFVDPCYDEKLWRHLRFDAEGQVHAYKGERRGRATIAHFKLDRDELTSARQLVFNANLEELFDALERRIEYDHSPSNLSRGAYSGAWFLHLREILSTALRIKPTNNIRQMVSKLRGLDDWPTRLQHARDFSRYEGPSFAKASAGSSPRRPAHDVMRSPTRLSIRNFKSLEKVDVILPTPDYGGGREAPALLILGENAAGKSTILEAIAIAMMGADLRANLGLKAGQLVLNPFYLGARAVEPPTSAEITLTFDDGREQTLRIAPTTDESRRAHIPRDFQESQPVHSIPLFAYGAFRQFLDAERRYAPHRYVRNMFHSNELLSNPEGWLLKLNDAQFQMAARALHTVFAIDANIDVLERSADGVSIVEAVTAPGAVEPTLRKTPLSLVSSGSRAILAMVCDIMHGLMDRRLNPGFQTFETARGIVLIDEVEAHLHPRWKMAIMTGLRRALPQMTFIATSHDPLCLRGMKKGEVLVLERIPGLHAQTSMPVFTQPVTDLPDSSHWTIGQLLTADFFQLRSTANADEERRLAEIQDKLARGVHFTEDPQVGAYLNQLVSDLPIGDNEAKRLIQKALAIFLAEQRQTTREKLSRLKEKTRRDIVDALRGAI
ncbi:AAA family ATPase [Ancylobacter sp.]|uniref:AAA family ATPase n=1 Tax=Ancylobacter sp. TaxID=1872567 RepID=UPI003D0EACC5